MCECYGQTENFSYKYQRMDTLFLFHGQILHTGEEDVGKRGGGGINTYIILYIVMFWFAIMFILLLPFQNLQTLYK